MFLACSTMFADGLLVSSDTSYPGYLLRNRVTEVSVKINGLVAETIVYQEFVNDWNKKVDAVYTFPLPENARSTDLFYTRNDTIFKAVLKVKQQVVNPGTGSGGIIAQINNYMGSNVIRIELKGIKPGDAQKVELHYFSMLDYYQGELTYSYPLNTQDFVTNPIDLLQFTIDVKTNSEITDYNIPTHPNFQTLKNEPNHKVLKMTKSMAYLASDFKFTYKMNSELLSMDSYSVKNDSVKSHFALFLRSQSNPVNTLSKSTVFVLSNSTTMGGYKIEQSIQAISIALDSLSTTDFFNIFSYNYYTSKWQNNLVPATAENIASAKAYLNGLTVSYGNSLSSAITQALSQFQNENNSNSIIVFTDGRAPLDPRIIRTSNLHHTGIFPVGLGDNLDRSKLEMLAELNYGFITYIKENDNIKEEVVKVLSVISNPLIKSTVVNFGNADITNVIPNDYRTIFAGSYLAIVGRYENSGSCPVYVSGEGVTDSVNFEFGMDLSNSVEDEKFPEYLWAKARMDELEREIDVYGETAAKKDSLIKLSLQYGMRCRYTAYIADYTNIVSDVEYVELQVAESTDGVSLEWFSTFGENIQGFEILKSNNGKDFVKIGYVDCYGSCIKNWKYNFTDFGEKSSVYYQIKQIDVDGNVAYSKILQLNGIGVVNFELNQNYPNPFNPSTNISFSIMERGEVSLIVYNILGQKIAELINNELEIGRYNVTLDASKYGMTSGIYFVEMNVKSKFRDVKKITLVK